ncbi:hypothetical protein L6164_002677 [Bauhinia variegata]|uniref:Uncharacterized protein n=1 Tax=Bauhinia variegata TaxID=167791 RepID=A0ACB9PZ34_BAUVA|nr:hypothetical protein L6164_002677 [Bauhinia variegata]
MAHLLPLLSQCPLQHLLLLSLLLSIISEMAKSYCCVFLFSSLAFLVTVFGVGATAILLGGKTLKIGIPIKTDFKEFVDIKLNSTNQAIQNQVSGYSINIFLAAVSYLERQLALNVSYEFEAFVNKEGNIAGTYDDLLHQIPEKKKAKIDKIVAKNGNLFCIWNYDGKIAFEDIIEAKEDFDIQYCIGTGGCGSVYKAKLHTGRIVAVKKLHSVESQNSRFAGSFCNEIKILVTEICHRNIVKLHGFC